MGGTSLKYRGENVWGMSACPPHDVSNFSDSARFTPASSPDGTKSQIIGDIVQSLFAFPLEQLVLQKMDSTAPVIHLACYIAVLPYSIQRSRPPRHQVLQKIYKGPDAQQDGHHSTSTEHSDLS